MKGLGTGRLDAWRAAFALLAFLLAFAFQAHAQNTTGNSGTGATLFTANCTGGCHVTPTSPYIAALNGANSGRFVIKTAALAGMGAPILTDQQFDDIAAYFAGFLPANNPNNQPIPYNSPGTSFAPTNITVPSPYSGLTTIVIVSQGAKGTVSYSSGTGLFTYTPTPGQFGSDSFTYRGSGGGITSSLRTATVVIANPPAPVVTSANTANGQTGIAFNYQITATNNPTSYGASGLPPGLSVNTGTGAITGTPTTQGVFAATVSATNVTGTGNMGVTFTITLGPPVITSSSTANGAEGVVFGGYTITASNNPTSYNASGLPPGLTVNTGTGAITGTPTVTAGPYPKVYNATVSATNATGTGNQGVTFTIAKPVPSITSAATANGQTGVPFTYSITATQGPITSYGATGLPPGLTFNTGTGVISGTPTTVGGPTNVTLTATNSTGTSANFNLAITITLGAPVVTSSTSASGGEGQVFSYQITATNSPTSFNATGLPAGLSVNTGTGLISGTPSAGTAAGSPYSITISATNGTGTGNATLTLSLSQFPPVITSAGTANGQTGVAFTYQITATNAPTSFNATGLPPGLTVNTSTGLISGTPSAVGTFNATMTAGNGSGSDIKPLVITIALGPPVITSAASAGGAVGFAMSYQIAATNAPTSFGATGLPPGLTVNTATGLVSGTPTANGVYNVTVSATNASGTGTRAVTFTIGVGVPVVTNATVAASTGVPFSYQVLATNGPTSWSASGLPSGLAIDPATGLISGVLQAFGTYAINVTATNGTGSGSGVITLNVSQSAPAVTSASTASAGVGQVFQYLLTIANGPATIVVTGLPPGLSYDGATQLIYGTPTAGGRYTVNVTVSNVTGTIQFALTIDVGFQPPVAGDLDVQVTYEEARAITLPITGQFTSVTITTLPDHGLVSVQGNVATYTPARGYSGEDRFTYTASNPAGTTAVATVRITIGTQVPVASAATMTVPLNTARTLDLSSFVKASGLTGVSIGAKPAHGTVTVDGTRVTYTPNTDFFGKDSFTYIAYGNAGTSSPATVTITVTGRPDPTQAANVSGLVDAQAQAARRFSGAQVGNLQRRMETLHRTPPPAGAQRIAETQPPRAAVPTQVAANDAAAPTATASDWMPTSLIAPLMGLASGSVALNGETGLRNGVQAWIAGTGQFGRRDAGGDRSGMRFSTDGISVGIDRRMGERLVLGLGIGYGRDESDISSDGSHSKARGASFAVYGSYQPTAGAFIDMMLGAGRLDFDSRRRVAAVDAFATGSRDGTQAFASVAAGVEMRRDGVLIAPYARLDVTRDRLDSFSETGVGDYALRFNDQTLRSTQVGAGIRLEAVHDLDAGRVTPRARLEYRRELQGQGTARLAYADLFNGPEYSLTPAGVSRNALLLGLGADLEFRGGLRFGFDWQAQRQSGTSNVHGFRLLVSQDLDGRGAPAWSWQPRMFKDPVGVEFGYTYDDNVTRGRKGEELGDRSFSLSVGEPIPFKLGSLSTVRLMVTPSITGEKFARYGGLGRISAGAAAELQYRSSGAFDAITWALIGRASYDQFESDRRRGPRYFAGVSARRAITDKIDVFAEAGRNIRDGRSDVFDTRDWAGKMNLDYSLGRRGVLYFAGEYRRGDIVSTGPASLANVGLAEVFVPDDAFEGLDLLAYRFPGRTAIGTMGWNYPLGPRDSFDLSWRRVQSSPLRGWGADGGSIRYQVNQYSIVYLMRF